MENNNYVSKIKENYTPHEHTKLDELKELDKKVKLPPTVTAYILGIVAALILGVGMCLAMKVLGTAALTDTALTALGVVIGVIGIALGVGNYFLYNALLSSRKKKYGARILELSNEILNK